MGFFEKSILKKQGLTKAIIEDNSYMPDDYNPTIISLMINDAVNICAHACSSCWDVKLPNGYKERSDYIAKRTKSGHSSVTEHSIHTLYMEVLDIDLTDTLELISDCEYLKTVYHHSNKWNKGYLLISGSWRAYNALIRKNISTHPNNKLLNRLMGIVYDFMDISGFVDLINEGIIPNEFNESPRDINDTFQNIVKTDTPIKISDKLECYGLDNMDNLIHGLYSFCPEPELFKPVELFNMASITILFKNMSRTATHQLVRHRNAITQESQRYVDYSDGCFASPDMFKDIYDPNYKYSIQFAGSSKKLTLHELGDAIIKFYNQLTDKTRTNNHALLKEDARAFLPSNVQCRKLFMTFTWSNLFAFLKLREDKHAQAEIRSYAIELGNWFAEQFPDYESCYRNLGSVEHWYLNNFMNHDKWNEVYKFNTTRDYGFVDSSEEFVEVMESVIEKENKEES